MSGPRSRKKWSEAAIAADAEGRIWFVHSRAPFSMHEFNEKLIALGVVRAMHVEGGPEASLSVKDIGDFEGSYETNFREDDKNREQQRASGAGRVADVHRHLFERH
jgi:hypothetical protein